MILKNFSALFAILLSVNLSSVVHANNEKIKPHDNTKNLETSDNSIGKKEETPKNTVATIHIKNSLPKGYKGIFGESPRIFAKICYLHEDLSFMDRFFKKEIKGCLKPWELFSVNYKETVSFDFNNNSFKRFLNNNGEFIKDSFILMISDDISDYGGYYTCKIKYFEVLFGATTLSQVDKAMKIEIDVNGVDDFSYSCSVKYYDVNNIEIK